MWRGPFSNPTLAPLHRLVPNLVDEVVAFLRHPRQAPDGSPTAAEIARRALLSFDAILRDDREVAAARERGSRGISP